MRNIIEQFPPREFSIGFRLDEYEKAQLPGLSIVGTQETLNNPAQTVLTAMKA